MFVKLIVHLFEVQLKWLALLENPLVAGAFMVKGKVNFYTTCKPTVELVNSLNFQSLKFAVFGNLVRFKYSTD